jgi:hypothetical protein
MEELKNIRNFEEFKDSVNEELLWDAIKGLFSKIFAKIDKKLADAVAQFTRKLDGAKNWQESVKFYEEAVTVEQADMKATLQTVTGPLGIRKVLGDNYSIIFVQLQELSNKYGSAELAAKNVFAGQPEAAIFNFDKSEQFNANLINAVNAKVMELGKGAGFNEQQLNTYLTQHTKIDEVQPAASGATNASFIYSKYNKIFEEMAPPTNQAATANPPAAIANPPAATGIPQGDLNKLKTDTEGILTNQIYGFTLKKVKEMKPPANVGQADAFDTVAKGAKVTNLYPNLAKLLRNIVNLPEDKKAELTQIRDIVAKATGKTPEDLKREMPL